MESALDILNGIEFGVVVGHFAGHLFGESLGRDLVEELDTATEKAPAERKPRWRGPTPRWSRANCGPAGREPFMIPIWQPTVTRWKWMSSA
jgi:hypothetical protein